MTSSSCTEKEDFFLRIPVVKLFQVTGTVLMLSTTIKPEVLDSSVIEEYLHDIHQLSKLREDQNFMICCNQFWKDSVQKLKFPT